MGLNLRMLKFAQILVLCIGNWRSIASSDTGHANTAHLHVKKQMGGGGDSGSSSSENEEVPPQTPLFQNQGRRAGAKKLLNVDFLIMSICFAFNLLRFQSFAVLGFLTGLADIFNNKHDPKDTEPPVTPVCKDDLETLQP